LHTSKDDSAYTGHSVAIHRKFIGELPSGVWL